MFQVNQWRGRRFSSADAFLRPAAKRANLTIRTKATVVGIAFEGKPCCRRSRRRRRR